MTELHDVLLQSAMEADYPEIVEITNLAFRDPQPGATWTSETAYISGKRLTEPLLSEDLAARPNAQLLTYRNPPNGPLLASVLLEPQENGVWYLGLLAVHPKLQNRQLGRTILTAAESFAKARGAHCIHITVINVRKMLIKWYERRGYVLTGATKPFPYGDNRFGKPLRDDLIFVVMERQL